MVPFPILRGITLNTFFHKQTAKILLIAQPVALVTIALIFGSSIGQGIAEILAAGPNLFIAIGLLHLIGFVLGYNISKIIFKYEDVARTISTQDKHQSSTIRCNLKIINPTGTAIVSKQDMVCFSGQVANSPLNQYLSAPVISFIGDQGNPVGT